MQACSVTSVTSDSAYQAPLFMGFSRQGYWSGLSHLPPGDPPNPGIKPTSPTAPALQADSLLLSHWGSAKWAIGSFYYSQGWNDDGPNLSVSDFNLGVGAWSFHRISLDLRNIWFFGDSSTVYTDQVTSVTELHTHKCYQREQEGNFRESESEVAQSCLTLCDPMDCSLPGSSVHGIFPGKNIGVGCHFLLQEIFPTQGLNLGSPAL